MKKKYFDFGLLLENKMDNFDRIGFFMDTFVEWNLLSGKETKENMKKYLSGGKLGEWLGDIDMCFVDKDDVTKDIYKKFSDIAMPLILLEPKEVRNTVGNTMFVVCKTGFGVFDVLTSYPIGYITLVNEHDLGVLSLHDTIFPSFDDIKIFLSDENALKSILNYLKDDFDATHGGNLS